MTSEMDPSNNISVHVSLVAEYATFFANCGQRTAGAAGGPRFRGSGCGAALFGSRFGPFVRPSAFPFPGFGGGIGGGGAEVPWGTHPRKARAGPKSSFESKSAREKAPSSFLLLVVRPGAPSIVLVPSSDALCS